MANNYWDEEAIRPKIIAYQQADEEERKKIYTQHLHTPIMAMIKAQIYTHKFMIYESYEDLVSVALENVLKQLDKYNPSHWVENKKRYARAFDYFSLVIKQSMFYYTKGREVKRTEKNIDDLFSMETNQYRNYDLQWYDFINFCEKYFDSYFSIKNTRSRGRMWKLLQIIKREGWYVATLTNRLFFREMRKHVDETNNTLRNFVRFLHYMSYIYINKEE